MYPSRFVIRMQIRVVGRHQIDSYHPDTAAFAKTVAVPKSLRWGSVLEFNSIRDHRDSGCFLSSFYCIETMDEKQPNFNGSFPLETAVRSQFVLGRCLKAAVIITGKTDPNQRHYKQTSTSGPVMAVTHPRP